VLCGMAGRGLVVEGGGRGGDMDAWEEEWRGAGTFRMRTHLQ
jgi:hypothetical protein